MHRTCGDGGGLAGQNGGYSFSPPTRDAVEGNGPRRRPQKRSDRRLVEVAKAVGGSYCRLPRPLKLALGASSASNIGRGGGGGGSRGGYTPSSYGVQPFQYVTGGRGWYDAMVCSGLHRAAPMGRSPLPATAHGHFPSIGGGAHRRLTALPLPPWPMFPSQLSTSLSFALVWACASPAHLLLGPATGAFQSWCRYSAHHDQSARC